MFLLKLFWIFVFVGGWYMGLSALRAGLQLGFTPDVLVNVVTWIGCGCYSIPRVWRFVLGGSPKPAAH
jgi:hypothetical protein